MIVKTGRLIGEKLKSKASHYFLDLGHGSGGISQASEDKDCLAFLSQTIEWEDCGSTTAE